MEDSGTGREPGGALEFHLHASRDDHDRLLLGPVGSVAAELESAAGLEILFFGRYNKPDWHLRLHLFGDPAWLRDTGAGIVGRHLDASRDHGDITAWNEAPYERETDRYGGEHDARLAERIFHEDTRACFEFLRAEADGLVQRTRREWCLLMTERYLDALGFDRARRIAFYRHSWRFEVDLGRWQDDELNALDRHFASIREDLLDLFVGGRRLDAALLWGGDAPARIAHSFLDSVNPLLATLRADRGAGGVRKNPIELAWSLTHMHCNRMQVEADAEAILRYFMFRLHEQEDLVGAP